MSITVSPPLHAVRTLTSTKSLSHTNPHINASKSRIFAYPKKHRVEHSRHYSHSPHSTQGDPWYGSHDKTESPHFDETQSFEGIYPALAA